MDSILSNESMHSVASRWWTLVVRGIAAIVFGVLTFTIPRISLMALVMLWAIYTLVDGVFALAMAARRGRAGQTWGTLLFEGLVGVAAGVVTFAWPGITALALLIVIAARAIMTGIAEIAAAIALRKHIHGEWMLAAGGLLSIAFGVLLLAFPAAGALAVITLIGAYAILFGALMIGLGLRVRRFHHPHEPMMHGGGTPRPA
jgi:uncharacterized membrane protein HdeD (DUF308 family)